MTNSVWPITFLKLDKDIIKSNFLDFIFQVLKSFDKGVKIFKLWLIFFFPNNTYILKIRSKKKFSFKLLLPRL